MGGVGQHQFELSVLCVMEDLGERAQIDRLAAGWADCWPQLWLCYNHFPSLS
jgi:hypothetical protein